MFLPFVMNIFVSCIDNLLNLLYNVKRLLCMFPFPLKRATVFFAFASMLLCVGSPCVGSTSNDDVLLLSGEAFRDITDASVRVSVSCRGEESFCALLVDIRYGEGLCLLSVEAGNAVKGMHISYADFGDRVRILIDGEHNCESEGELFSLRFAYEDGNQEHALLDFSFLSPISAYRIAERGFLPLETAFSWADEGLGEDDPTQMRFSFSLANDGAGALLYVTGNRPLCVAVGVEVTAVDLEKGTVDSFVCVKATDRNGALELNGIALPTRGRVCVILRPVCYQRTGARFGENTVYYFVDGALCG